MWEALSRNPGNLAMVIFWGMIFLTILVTYGMKTWRKHEAARMEHELKLEMLSRGMSADDIERVLAAKSTANRDSAKRSRIRRNSAADGVGVAVRKCDRQYERQHSNNRRSMHGNRRPWRAQ